MSDTRISQVEEQLNLLEEELDYTTDRLDSLCDMLKPLLREVPVLSEPVTERETLVPIAARLGRLRDKFRVITEGLVSINDTCEL